MSDALDLDELRALCEVAAHPSSEFALETARRQLAGAVPLLLDRIAELETRLAAAEACRLTMRVGIEAAIIDWRVMAQVSEDGMTTSARAAAFNDGAAWTYRKVLALTEQILDGTVTDNDFDDAEYAEMLALAAETKDTP